MPDMTSSMPDGNKRKDVFFAAQRIGLRLHMRKRTGFTLRGMDLWYDRTMPIERQAAMIESCLARVTKPVRKAGAVRRRADAA